MLTDEELVPLLKAAFQDDTRTIAAPGRLTTDVRHRIADRRRTGVSIVAGVGVAAACAVGVATMVSGGHESNPAAGGPTPSGAASAPGMDDTHRAVALIETNLRSELLPTPPVGKCLDLPAPKKVPEDDEIYAPKPRQDCLIGYTNLVGTRPANAEPDGSGIFLTPADHGTRTGYKAVQWPAVGGHPGVTKWWTLTAYASTDDATMTKILSSVTVEATLAVDSSEAGQPGQAARSSAEAKKREQAGSAARSAADRAKNAARTAATSGRP